MRLLLVCNVEIVKKIFSLVCKKLNIDLYIKEDNNIEEKFDILIMDTEFVDDSFNYKKQFCLKIGAISNEDLTFDKSRDFIIPRPFLPIQLQEILQDIVLNIKEDEEKKKLEDRKKSLVKEDDYMNLIANDIAQDIENENDESIVSFAALKEGGVLDPRDLGKIQNLLNIDLIQNEIEMEEEDWLDLSEIIDKALDEVKDYEFETDKSDIITLILSKFTMEELKPLLLRLDQNSIDKLTTGKSISLELKLKEEV